MSVSEIESDDYSANLPSENGEEQEALEFVVPIDLAGLRLDQALARLLPQYSRSRLQQWVKAERVLLDADVATPKTKVWGGETVLVLPELPPEQLAFRAEVMDLPIVHEDDALLVINKPAGLVVHPGHGNWSGTLLNGLLAHCPALFQVPRAGIVHRLDKDTSGLMVVAKTLTAQTELVRQLQARTVKREYCALVRGHLNEAGTVDAAMGRHPRERTLMSVLPAGSTGAKPAVTHYEPLDWYRHATLVECRLETGRTHQIRVHMQSIGHPLFGDPVYGGGNSCQRFPRQALHALRLGLQHPQTGQSMQWESSLPEDMQTLLDELEAEDAAD
ncbi:23S rRNA pseudouridine(1911/1915/1917) synthase RluD [Leeia sp.]|uniref:23S rRNA pseudouridine(1911/1915/1917) synthase RluD n=1 Tax=Leeia sp. TaxID=2884678 RepID=UPI0035AD9A9E